MSVEQEMARVAPKKDMLLTIGVFDGVHLGHKHLLAQLRVLARQQDLLSGVVTFRRHPQEMLLPETRLPYLTNLAQRVNLLRAEGVDHVVVLTFDRALAQLSAREFVGLLRKYLRMRGLVVGPDFALGKDREGSIANLRKLGGELDFSVTVVPPITMNGDVVSSTAIRKALTTGDMERVQALSGRAFSLRGIVVAGTSQGVKLGFPTANIEVEPDQALPADGVYATMAYVGDRTYPSVTNIGLRPTFNGKQRTVEVYIMDYSGNLYGQELRIDVIERLRGEKRFADVEALKKQIGEDVKQGRAILGAS
ncbi:MAG: bifunctional riboflavin kinase/FAD synthetase [Chloroflexi bacterium]|nr:bifunctional riboflavin kinase/FAD synthetase [Chloroflexota bacterium]